MSSGLSSAAKGGEGGSAKKSKEALRKLVVGKNQQNDDNVDDDEQDEDEDDDEGGIEISKTVLRRVIALKKSQEEMEEVEKEYKLERIALEKKYLAKRLPFFELRSRIVSGEFEPPVPVENEAEPEDASAETDEKGIPGFWLQSLATHPSIGYLITEEDEPALEALSDIKCEYDEEFKSFTLYFYFKENDFFTNSVLTKKYGVTPSLLDDTAPALTLNEGTEINWKPSKNLTVSEITKKQKAKSGKNKGQTRTVTKTVPKASFFHYFSTPKPEDEEEEEEEPKEGEEEERIKLTMEEDYDIGHTIRTSIIPQAVLWYTGDADDGEYADEDEDDEEDDDDADDDEDEGDDEEDEAEVQKSKKPQKGKKGGRGGFAGAAGAPAGGEAQPECKQN